MCLLHTRVCPDTPGTAHGYRLDGRMSMTSTKTEKHELAVLVTNITLGLAVLVTNITLGLALLPACDPLLYIIVLVRQSEIISINRHKRSQKFT
jgi:hypothetical protein